MSNLTRIVCVVVDVKEAIFYKEDGTIIEMLQGDPRLRDILEVAVPALSAGGPGYIDIDFSGENSWKNFEEKTNGAVRLFRIAKSKLAGLFGAKKEEVLPSGTIGTIPVPGIVTAIVNPATNNAAVNTAVVEEILKHAVPVSDPNFHEATVAEQRPTAVGAHTPSDSRGDGESDPHFDKSPDTIVAITKSGNVIEGVEQIKSQFTNAAQTGNTVGMERFLERLGKVIAERSHSVKDLLRFMERGDLPVADDGTIIIYKRLCRRGDHYVDAHTGLVKQRVGSYVHMDKSLVDPNRRNECSNGLHVARRGYIRSFSGDVVVLAKVRPEDVIAVPDYDANKMRVCGYHIIAELNAAQFQAITSNRNLSNAEGGEQLLAKAIAGDHIGITEMVKIGGQNGTNLTITSLDSSVLPMAVAQAEPKVEDDKLDNDLDNDDESLPVTVEPEKQAEAPKEVVKQAKPTKRNVKASRKAAVKRAKASKLRATPLEAGSALPSAPPVDVMAINKLKEGKATTLAPEGPGVITQEDAVKAMWDKALGGDVEEARKLLDFKKKAKKGWHVWGLPSSAGDTLKAMLVA